MWAGACDQACVVVCGTLCPLTLALAYAYPTPGQTCTHFPAEATSVARTVHASDTLALVPEAIAASVALLDRFPAPREPSETCVGDGQRSIRVLSPVGQELGALARALDGLPWLPSRWANATCTLACAVVVGFLTGRVRAAGLDGGWDGPGSSEWRRQVLRMCVIGSDGTTVRDPECVRGPHDVMMVTSMCRWGGGGGGGSR